jgi:hypothetical protein
LSRLGISSLSWHQLGICRLLPLFSMMVTYEAARAHVDMRNGYGPHMMCQMTWKNDCRRSWTARPDIRAL